MFENWTMAMLRIHGIHRSRKVHTKDDCERFWDGPVRELIEKLKTCNEMSKRHQSSVSITVEHATITIDNTMIEH